MKKCKKCAKDNTDTANFCADCGEKIEMPIIEKIKFCRFCGQEIKNENTVFCGNCGSNIINLDPPTTSIVSNNTEGKDYDFLYIPISRLIWVSILSFGLYTIYWFSYNWSAIQKVSCEKMSPFWRGVFSIFWSKKPFELAIKQAKGLGYKHSYNATFLSIFYAIACIVNNAVGRSEDISAEFAIFWLIAGGLLFISPLIKVQSVINWSSNNKSKVFNKIGRAEFGFIAIAWLLAIILS